MKRMAKIAGETFVVLEEQILKFQQHIESIVDREDCTYLEAISQYCEDNDVDLDSVRNLMSVPLMQKLKDEVRSARMLKEEESNTLFGV